MGLGDVGDDQHRGRGWALVYLRDGETLAVRNVLTGAQAFAYESPAATAFTAPVIVSGS